MVYGLFGVFPIKIDIYTKMIKFWSKRLIVTYVFYLYSLHENNNYKSDWIQCIRHILISCGVPQIWTLQKVENQKWLTCYIKQKLKDHFINDWFIQCEKSSNYRIYNISSHVLKISEISLVPRIREFTDIFITFDEIYFVFT